MTRGSDLRPMYGRLRLTVELSLLKLAWQRPDMGRMVKMNRMEEKKVYTKERGPEIK